MATTKPETGRDFLKRATDTLQTFNFLLYEVNKFPEIEEDNKKTRQSNKSKRYKPYEILKQKL